MSGLTFAYIAGTDDVWVQFPDVDMERLASVEITGRFLTTGRTFAFRYVPEQRSNKREVRATIPRAVVPDGVELAVAFTLVFDDGSTVAVPETGTISVLFWRG